MTTTVTIDRHLVDEEWRDAQLDAGTHLLNPEQVTRQFASHAEAINFLHEVASEWGCVLGTSEASGYSFDGPEEGEVQGYATVATTITVWVVSWVNLNFSDEYGAKVFATEAQAQAWATEFVADEDEDEPRFDTDIEAQTLTLNLGTTPEGDA